MAKAYKYYVEEETQRKLLAKASDVGFEGRGAISKYLRKVANEPIVFLDKNVKAILESLKLNSTQ